MKIMLGPLYTMVEKSTGHELQGILKFNWPRATLLSCGGLHYGQESFGGELCT